MNTSVGFTMAFDGKPIMSAAEQAQRKILIQFGAYVRTVARRSIKKGGPRDKSPEGAPPVGHGNQLYANFIAFGYEPHEVAIGSQLLGGTLGDVAPEKIEYGGKEAIVVGKGRMRRRIVAQFGPRPAMRLAFDVAVKKLLPKLIENSIVP